MVEPTKSSPQQLAQAKQLQRNNTTPMPGRQPCADFEKPVHRMLALEQTIMEAKTESTKFW